MTVNQLADLLDAKVDNLPDGERELTAGYCGDFLSFVMGKAPEGCAWFTVMNNVNVCAVATLADCGAVVLCEGVFPDAALSEKVRRQDVNLLLTDKTVYEAALATAGKLGG